MLKRFLVFLLVVDSSAVQSCAQLPFICLVKLCTMVKWMQLMERSHHSFITCVKWNKRTQGTSEEERRHIASFNRCSLVLTAVEAEREKQEEEREREREEEKKVNCLACKQTRRSWLPRSLSWRGRQDICLQEKWLVIFQRAIAARKTLQHMLQGSRCTEMNKCTRLHVPRACRRCIL